MESQKHCSASIDSKSPSLLKLRGSDLRDALTANALIPLERTPCPLEGSGQAHLDDCARSGIPVPVHVKAYQCMDGS